MLVLLLYKYFRTMERILHSVEKYPDDVVRMGKQVELNL